MRFRAPGGAAVFAALALATIHFAPARAGVANPDLSVIGQPFLRWTDAAGDPARLRPVLDAGETEVVADAYLNPYAKGSFVFAFADGEVGVEEGYFTLLRGLPAGIALKGGRYRAGFGRLNAMHPHQLPFAGRFRVLAEYLPGDEAFTETGVQAGRLFALPGDAALTASADVLQGDSFRRPREPLAANDPLQDPGVETADDRAAEPRAAVLGRLSVFVPVGARSGVDLGVSATRGTNNVAAAARTTVWGADVKAKLWRSARSYLLLQGEYLALERGEAAWDSAAARYVAKRVTPSGGGLLADWNVSPRFNLGLGWERFRRAADGAWDGAFRAFCGLALMEESTSFRLDWERFTAGAAAGAAAPGAVHTLTLRAVFSMGPHKAHTF